MTEIVRERGARNHRSTLTQAEEASMLGFGPISSGPISSLPLSSPFTYTIPASETPEGKERIRAYFESLGRFVDKFSRVEHAVAHTLWLYAQSPAKIAKVIFAGARVETSMTFIKQTVEATGAPKPIQDDLLYIFQQLGIINGARNLILHHGAESVAEGSGVVSDKTKARGEPRTFPISPELRGQMTDDLDKIIVHLNYRHLKRPAPRGTVGRELLGQIFQRPWRYKHPAQPPKHPKKADG
jgi:hypothetical protein